MSQLLDKLEKVRGLPVIIGAALVLLNFVIQCFAYGLTSTSQPTSFLLFLVTDGNLFLHLGVIVGLLGVLIGDIL